MLSAGDVEGVVRTSPTRLIVVSVVTGKDAEVLRCHLIQIVPLVLILLSCMRQGATRPNFAIVSHPDFGLVVGGWNCVHVAKTQWVSLYRFDRFPYPNEEEPGAILNQFLCFFRNRNRHRASLLVLIVRGKVGMNNCSGATKPGKTPFPGVAFCSGFQGSSDAMNEYVDLISTSPIVPQS